MVDVEEKRLTQIIADNVRYRTMMGQRTGRVEEQEKLGKISEIRPTLKLDVERARHPSDAGRHAAGVKTLKKRDGRVSWWGER